MKKYILLLITTCVFIANSVIAQKISVNYNNVPFRIALKDILEKTGIGYLMEVKCLEQTRPVTLKLENVSISEFLNKICAEQPIEYYMTDKVIFLVPRSVKGQVLDAEGNPLANVQVEGTYTKASTDRKGRFFLQHASCDPMIKFSSHARKPKSVAIRGKTNITVVMETIPLPPVCNTTGDSIQAKAPVDQLKTSQTISHLLKQHNNERE